MAVRPGAKGNAMAGRAAPGIEVQPGKFVVMRQVRFEAGKSAYRSG